MKTATMRPSVLRSRKSVVAMMVVIVLVAAAAWWFGHADERRVNAACGTYLQQRGLLRDALSETDEAAERAVAAKANRVEDQYFNDADEVRSWVDRWLRESPSVVDSLADDKDAARSLTFVAQGFVELQSLIEKSEPDEVADWLQEMNARLQDVDDTCLWAARSTSL